MTTAAHSRYNEATLNNDTTLGMSK